MSYILGKDYMGRWVLTITDGNFNEKVFEKDISAIDGKVLHVRFKDASATAALKALRETRKIAKRYGIEIKEIR